MATKAEIENFIVDVVQQMGNFQHIDAALISEPMMHQFIDAGFALLEYYQNSADTEVDDSILGSYVDCAMLMNGIATDESYPTEIRQQAEEMTRGLEDLVNAITNAVEQNISNKR